MAEPPPGGDSGDSGGSGKSEDSRRRSAAYQGASEAAFAILISTGIGWWVDRSWETAPIGVVTGATIGFAAFVLRLIRLGKAMNESPPDSNLSTPGDDLDDRRQD